VPIDELQLLASKILPWSMDQENTNSITFSHKKPVLNSKHKNIVVFGGKNYMRPHIALFFVSIKTNGNDPRKD
jgi:hypothetical protein